MLRPPSEFQLRTQGERLLDRHPQARLLAFYCPQGYQGSSQVLLKGQAFEIAVARSPLHFHRLAAASEEHQQHLLVLCPERSWLSQDLRDRLPDRDLRELDPWESIRKLFDAESIDPGLQRHRELAEWLLECDPREFSKAPGGVLTRELAWETLLHQRFGLTNECYDLLQLLRTLTLANSNNLSASERLKRKAREWLDERGGGPPVDQVLELYFERGPREALALCLVLEVVFLAPAGPAALMAQGSLDRFFAGRRLPVLLGQHLGRSFRELVRLDGDLLWLGPVLTRAKELLVELNALELAQFSLILEEGWDGLLARASLDLTQSQPFRDHWRFTDKEEELVPLEMAQRLERFLAAPGPRPSGTLAAWMDDYLDRVAWVDRARLWLQHPHPQLGGAFSRLLERALEWREAYSKGFAQALLGPQKETLPVESFLDHVLVPLVKEKGSHLLVLVMDGCSQAALLDLLDSLDQRNWSHYLPQAKEKTRLLSALPSVTEVARTSLLCGRLMQGDARDEANHFKAHSALNSACRKDYGPQLFHKKDMQQALQRTQSADYKLVAVVINSIDDALAKEEQLNLRWTQHLIAPLVPLLEAARAVQRSVLIVSDHGHTLDFGTVERPSVGAGNRWQPGGPEEEGAVLVEGGRLQLAESARLLYTEKVRYGPRKRGYHGGSSPQEMCCALALLASPGQTIAGWMEGSRRTPAWWSEAGSALVLEGGGKGQGQLFETVLSERLLASPALRDREGRPPFLERVIDLLSERGRMERAALAQALGQTRSQLNLLLPQWTRWLNVNGQVTLRADNQGVWLDEAAVKRLLG